MSWSVLGAHHLLEPRGGLGLAFALPEASFAAVEGRFRGRFQGDGGRPPWRIACCAG